MNKIIFYSILLFSVSLFSQFSVTDSDGNVINDNDVFTYNSNTYPDADLEFIVTNENQNDGIDVVITVESISNSNGSGMGLCFGSCYTGVQQGLSYPTPAYHLDAGASSEPHGNHFENTQSSNQVITYVFKFHQVDVNGNEIGTPLRISYVYDANSTANLENDILSSVNLFPNPTKGQFTIDHAEGFNVSIYSVLGKEIMRRNNISSQESFETSNLSEGTYFVKISSNNSSKTEKLVVTK